MLEVFVTVLIGLVFAIGATWVTQHVLGATISWIRALVLVAIVYALTVPLVRAALESGGVISDGRFDVSGGLGIVILAVALGWQFAIAVAVIMVTELFWPSGRGWHPIRAVQGMLHRRARLRRYAEVLRIASRHGLSLYGSHRSGGGEDVPAALVAVLNEAGPTFVKIGQVLSTRDDLLPREFTDAFASLQMNTTPLPWADIKTAIETELGGPLEATFAWVDETPLAAASLAQVHAARLRSAEPGGVEPSVVIKVQRPDARASVQVDTDILQRLAADAERRSDWARAYGVRALVDEFVRALTEELDYRIEVENTELLRDTLQRSTVRNIHVPQVYPALCTKQLMVQERVVGVPFSDLHGALPADMADAPPREQTTTREFDAGAVSGAVSVTSVTPPPTARDIGDTLVDAIFEQVALRGVFHADLHPGNLILRPDGEITLIDFGSIGVLERSMRRVLIAMMSAMGAEDDIALTDLLLMIVEEPADGSRLDRSGLQHEIGAILTRVHNGRGDATIFREVIDVLRGHRLALPAELALVFRTLGSLEGTLRHLDPDYEMVERALERTPHFVRIAADPRGVLADARVQLQVAGEQLRRLPRRIETIGAALENGTFGLNLRMFRDPRERGWVRSLVSQLTTALIGVTLVIAAVILLVSDGGPQLTAEIGLFPFLGSILGLAGMLLVLGSLRRTAMRNDVGS